MNKIQFMVREAHTNDIEAMQAIRAAVLENRLNNPELVQAQDYILHLKQYGKGWVFDEPGKGISGFAILNNEAHQVWALFVDPAQEGRGIGQALHDAMLNWYFKQSKETLWLSTAPDTRAAAFYTEAGWQQHGYYGNELRFEMSAGHWRELAANR